MKKVSILFSVLISVFSCKNEETTSVSQIHDPITISLDDFESKNDLSILDKMSDLSVIDLKGIPELNQIGRIKRVIQKKDKFFIFDDLKSNILVFNKDGVYEGLIGERGAAPQQYQRINDFDINEKKNKVYLLNNPYLFTYDLDGNFISKKLLDFYPVKMKVMIDGNIAFNLPTLDDEFCHLMFSDHNGNLITKRACYENFGDFIGNSRTGGVNLSTNEAYYNYTGVSSIYQIDNDYNLNIKFNFDLGNDMWPSDKQANVGDFRKRFKSNTVSFLYNSYCINKGWMIFEYKLSGKDTTLKAYFNIIENKLYTIKSFEEEQLIDLLGVPVGLDKKQRFISGVDFEVYNELKEVNNTVETIKKHDMDLYNKLSDLSLNNTYLLILYSIEK